MSQDHQIPDNAFDGIYWAMKTHWTGTAIMCSLLFTAFGFSPWLHALVGWYGAWWCYLSIKDGYRGFGRLVVGFLCWTASFDAIGNVFGWAMIYFALARVGANG